VADVQVEQIDPITDRRWAEFVAVHPAATVFHHPRWLHLLRAQYGYPLVACCLTEPSGRILAGLPLADIDSRLTGRRLVALPFSDSCPPLLPDPAGGTAEELARAVSALRGPAQVPLEIHEAFPELAGAEVVHRFHQHVLRLDAGLAAVEGTMRKSGVRRTVVKARQSDLTVEQSSGIAALRTFYGLHLETRRRLGVPTQPKRFIERFSQLFEAGLGFVTLVWHQGRPAAAAVFLTFNRTVMYKYGASAQWALPLKPNNLLFDEAIRWSCGQGYTRLDFGRTELDNVGLARFKRGWGAEELPLSYTYVPRAPEAGHSRRDQLVADVIRRSPPAVGRLAGELLYKHYG
jgi:hypothetical protein